MRRLRGTAIILAAGVSTLSLGVGAAPAMAQGQSMAVPAMPLAEAIDRIAAAWGVTVDYDPDAVRGRRSVAVRSATSPEDALRQAVRGSTLTVSKHDGRLTVSNDILVIAGRDEAETGFLARSTSTSTRTGDSLRRQPRNAQIISSRLMEEQQSQSIYDALRNAGGVSVNTATVQGGVTYTVRGFGTGGLTNGLPTSGLAASATQPVANVERLEVLKGPDALLSGAQNLGGTVNIVTKKPSAEAFVQGTLEAGSFGQRRSTADATGALNGDKTVSARVIASANQADRNWGGYAGLRDNLIATSLRFKNANTDAIVGVSLGDQFSPASPYTLLNPVTNQPFVIDQSKPLYGRKRQGARTESVQAYGEVTQKVADWLTLVGRGQHQEIVIDVASYSPFGVINGTGLVFSSNSHVKQQVNSNAVDGYARFEFATGPLFHKLIVGATHVQSEAMASSATGTTGFTYNVLTETQPARALPPINRADLVLNSHQTGIYGQYQLKFWQITLLAGVRRNDYASTIRYFTNRPGNTESNSATTPNFGAIVDITKNLSVYGSLAYGYVPTTIVDRFGDRLPDLKTRNAETGVKLDLLGGRALFNGSWFRLYQSVTLTTDPVSPAFQMAVPGMQATGIDLNLAGRITRNWLISAAYTNAKYEFLTFSRFGNTVQAQPRETYSLYSSYRHKVAEDLTAGLGGGLFGRSSASVTRTGSFYVPPAVQVDLNAFVKWQAFDLNVGVRNLFDRFNYGISYNTTYLPIAEPRTVRATLSYRFR